MSAVKSLPDSNLTVYFSDVDLLKRNAFCHELSEEAQSFLQTNGEYKSFAKGEIVLTQGKNADKIFLLLRGKVTISASRMSGESTIIDMLPTGSIFLIAAALLDRPHLGNIEAGTELRVLSLSADKFNEGLKAHHTLALATLTQLAQQTRMLMNQIRLLKLQTANERLAHYLLIKSKRNEGPAVIELEEERRIIAQRLGMTPESLSRSIVALREMGVLFEQRIVRIDDMAKLHAYSGLEVIR